MDRIRETPASDGGPLIEAKLARPRARDTVMGRPRLFAALDRLADTELTLISASAGSGKTVLLASWLAARPQVTSVWVTLDADDDDPVRLWTYVAEAVDRVRSGVGQPALATLRRPRSSVEVAVDELLNGIADWSGQVVIALDDLHHVRSETGLRLLTYAIERLPPAARVMATTRIDPSLRLARLRARGALGEIRAHDLAFTVEETTELLVGRTGIALGDGDVTLLVERTEGWPAGIGLAGLWLAGTDSPAEQIREFSGNQRHLVDYLTAEVLDTVDEPTRSFLLRTSILDRFTAALCDAVLGSDDSAARLAALERSNLFLVPLDSRGGWYRYHHLFRDVLQSQPGSPTHEAASALHQHAADWFLAHGHVGEALVHISASGDIAALADTLAAEHMDLIRRGRVDLFMTWLEALPTPELISRPVLAAAGALSAGLLALPAARLVRLARIAETGSEDCPEDERSYITTVIAVTRAGLLDHDLSVTLEATRQAVELARNNGDELVVPAVALRAYALYLDGEQVAARATADEALGRPEAPQRPHGLVYAHAVHALTQCDAGQVPAGEAEARHAVTLARGFGLAGAWSAGIAHHALGYGLLRQGRSAEAERELERAEILRRAAHPRLDHIHSLLVLAQARVARGKLTLAASELADARQQLGAFADSGHLPELAGVVDVQLAAALGGSAHPVEPPSPAELAVLRLLASSLSRREIGSQLFLTMNTVKTHTSNLYRKLGVNSRDAAVRRARTIGLIEKDNSPG